MTDRPTEHDLALDAIDDQFKAQIAQMMRDLGAYGVPPVKTFEDAQKLAREVWQNARTQRNAAIAIISE